MNIEQIQTEARQEVMLFGNASVLDETNMPTLDYLRMVILL